MRAIVVLNVKRAIIRAVKKSATQPTRQPRIALLQIADYFFHNNSIGCIGTYRKIISVSLLICGCKLVQDLEKNYQVSTNK